MATPCFAIVVLCNLVGAADVGATDTSFVPPVQGLYPARDAQCGPRCVYIALKRLGFQPDYLDLLHDAETSARGTSIGGLDRAARAYGAYSQAISVSDERLCALLVSSDQPLIAICHQTDPDHFVVMNVSSDRRLMIIDPQRTSPAQWEPFTSDTYSGAALLLSDRPISVTDLNHSKHALPRWAAISLLILATVLAFAAGFRLASRPAGAITTRDRITPNGVQSPGSAQRVSQE